MEDDLWLKTPMNGDAWCTDNDINTDTDADANTNTDTNIDTDTNTNGWKVIMDEVSLQKNFPYSGRMCCCAPFLHKRHSQCTVNVYTLHTT